MNKFKEFKNNFKAEIADFEEIIEEYEKSINKLERIAKKLDTNTKTIDVDNALTIITDRFGESMYHLEKDTRVLLSEIIRKFIASQVPGIQKELNNEK